MEIKFINDKITFGQLKFGDLFMGNSTDDSKENIIYMKINCFEGPNAVNLITGDTSYFYACECIIPLRGSLEVTKI